MKQIKTVVCTMDTPKRFDKEVNALLADGWELVKRKLVHQPGGNAFMTEYSYYPAFYAEMEKEVQ